MNYPHLPRVFLLNTVGADFPTTSATEQVPSMGRLDGTTGVMVAFTSDANPTAGAGAVDFVVQGSWDGETWEALVTFDETDFVAAADPATTFVYSSVVPYRPTYRVQAVAATNLDAVTFKAILVK